MTNWSIEATTIGLVKAGFPRDVQALVKMNCIAQAESNWNPAATNPSGIQTPTPGAYGMFQIMYPLHQSLFQHGSWSDGNYNCWMATQLYKQSGFAPWNGDGWQALYSKYGAQYTQAVNNGLHGDPGGVTSGIGPIGIPNPLSGIESAISSIGSLFGKIFDPALWERIGLGLLGAGMLIVGIVIVITRDTDVKGHIEKGAELGAMVAA